MIINFSVQNFGSIKEKQTLSFEAGKSTHLEEYYIIEPIPGLRLNKLALIYGANASGKTTVLKALDFLRKICTEPFNTKTEKFDFEPFLFDENTPTENTKFELEFVQNKIKYFYEVELNKTHIVREKLLNYNPNKAVVFERTTNEEKELTSIKFGGKIENKRKLETNLEIHTLWNNTVISGFLKSNVEKFEPIESIYGNLIDLSESHNIENFVSDMISESFLSKKFVLQNLIKADFNISNIEIERKTEPYSLEEIDGLKSSLGNDLSDKILSIFEKHGGLHHTTLNVNFEHIVNNNRYHLPIKHESDGTRKFYGYQSLLSSLIFDRKIIAVDELESSLHPDLFNHFLLTYLVNGKKESQLIATTHNREILNNKDIFRDDAIWFTDKDENSATELYSLADFDSSVIRDKSNVLNAYKSGKLGAVPNLGDYYIDLEDES